MAGDSARLNVSLGRGTRCFLGSQASTKVYRNPAGLPCTHTLGAKVGSEAVLVLAPDPIQCFAGSLYEQRQEFFLEAGASLVLVDWLSAGRLARGERWAFGRFESRNEIFVADERLLIDALRLDPSDGPIDSPFRMGRFNCLATVVVFGAAVQESARQILDRVSCEPVSRRGALVQAASPLRSPAAQVAQSAVSPTAQPAERARMSVPETHGSSQVRQPAIQQTGQSALQPSAGVILRIAGTSVEQAGAVLASHLGFVRDLLRDDPWARKW